LKLLYEILMVGRRNGMYSYMLTDAFAQKLSAGHGLGLSGLLERQFSPRGETAPAATASSPGQPPAAPLP
jgi:Rod binding domain-containing protein